MQLEERLCELIQEYPILYDKSLQKVTRRGFLKLPGGNCDNGGLFIVRWGKKKQKTETLFLLDWYQVLTPTFIV